MLRSRSRDRSWSRSQSTALSGVGVGVGVGQILPTPIPARRRGTRLVNKTWFCRTVMHGPGNIGRKEEKESGSEKIELKRHVIIEFGQTVHEIILGSLQSFCYCVNQLKNCHTEPIQRNQRYPRSAASAVGANGCWIAVSPVWIQSKGKSRKLSHNIALFRA